MHSNPPPPKKTPKKNQVENVHLLMHAQRKAHLATKASEVTLVCAAFAQVHPQPNSPSPTHQAVMSLITKSCTPSAPKLLQVKHRVTHWVVRSSSFLAKLGRAIVSGHLLPHLCGNGPEQEAKICLLVETRRETQLAEMKTSR